MLAKRDKPLDIAITTVAVAMLLYHLASTQLVIQSPKEHLNTHLVFSLILAFLASMKMSKKFWPLTIAMVLLSIVATSYVKIFYNDLELHSGFPTTMDIIMGAIIVITVIEACRRRWGWALVITTCIFIVYALSGQYIPGRFGTPPISVSLFIYEMSTGLTGIYGEILHVSANYIFLFMAMGGLLSVGGAAPFFHEVGILVGRRLKGGAAIACVTGSTLLGTVTGAVGPNVAIVGRITIPMMVKAGYKPVQAAAIEAASSTGGQIMPPVMGSVAFILASYTGIPYLAVCVAALIPALLYYFSIGLYCQFNATKLNLTPVTEKANVKELLLNAYSFIIPLGVIVFLFVLDYSPMYVGFWAVIVTAALAFVRKATRPSFGQWLSSLTEGVTIGADIGVSCAIIGIVVKVFSLTGLGILLSSVAELWSGGIFIIALLLVMIITIVLGCGLPTPAAYMIVAMVTAPVLIKMGGGLLPVHLFVLYFAVIGFITPPVAPAAMIAARLAGTAYIRTSVEAIKPAIGGFLVPFMFMFAPALILQTHDLSSIAIALIISVLGLFSMQVALVGHFNTKCTLVERVLFGACAVALLGFFMVKTYAILIAPIIVLILLIISQRMRAKRALPLAVSSDAKE